MDNEEYSGERKALYIMYTIKKVYKARYTSDTQDSFRTKPYNMLNIDLSRLYGK